MNASRVLLAGLAAGIVGNVVGFVGFGMLLGPRIQAEAAAVVPSLAERGMSGGVIAVNIGTQFLIGILLAFLYAAMRPRFGPGVRTAVFAALVVWMCGFLFRLDWLLIGAATVQTYALSSALALFQVIAAASAGGFFYRESDAKR